MKFLAAVLSLAFVLAFIAPARAQEPELISEIVARVNNEIITRADYLNALSDFKAELARQLQQQGKGNAEITAEYERLKHTVLDIMIEDLLLEQKAKELGIDQSRLNVNGGAVALGHPLGCTGAKLTATILHEMQRRKSRYGLVTMCVGGGMGAAGIFELL